MATRPNINGGHLPEFQKLVELAGAVVCPSHVGADGVVTLSEGDAYPADLAMVVLDDSPFAFLIARNPTRAGVGIAIPMDAAVLAAIIQSARNAQQILQVRREGGGTA